MAITAHKLRRCEVWDKWAAAGGVRQAVVVDATILTAKSNIAGSDQLDLTLPLISPAAPFVVPGAVVRVEESDSVFDEWLIADGPNDDDGSGIRAVQGLPIRAAMATCELVRRIDSDGTSVLDFESVGLTPAQHIAAWVIPALTRGGMAWVVAGTITPTKLLDLTFASDTPLSVLQRIADQTGMELDIRRTGGGYAIDLIAEIGSAQPIADLRFDKNLQPGTKRNRSSLESATRVFPIGADEEGRRATMSRATWKVTNIAGLVVTLADPAGGAGPIQFDGQLAGLNGTTAAYLRKPGGTLTAVTASSFANQTVTVASAASLAVNDLVQFRSDSAGSDLLWLDSPSDRLLYGLKVGTAEMSDVPSTNNLLKNSVMRSWLGSSSAPPPNWTKLGGGTVDRQAASPYTRVGGFSIHRVGVADGDGVVSDAVPLFLSATNPNVSGYGGLWVVAGQVRVELVFTTPGGPVVQPLPPDFATNSVLGQWEELGVSFADSTPFTMGATAVALRVVQHGATAADFYLDYGQVTESSSQLPLAESSGGTRLWQAANEKLRTGGAPLVSYAVPIVDLAALDPVTWGEDCKVVVGGKVRVTDPRLSLAITTRLVELVRDYKLPGDTKVTLSNKPDDISGSLALVPSVSRSGAEVTPTEVESHDALKAGVIKDITPFASSLTPVEIVAVLPTTGNFVGRMAFLTTDKKLYRWDGAAWTAAVPTVDLTGQIDTAQITNAAVTAAKIGALAVTAGKIAANAVGILELDANSVNARNIVAASITTAEIAAAAAITGAQIAAATIGASNIVALSITAAQIAASTITAAKIAANTITAAQIAALTITASEIAAGAITTAKILAGAVTANEIASHTITAANIVADTITASEIAAGAITSTELAANSVIAGKIAALSITAAEIAALTITAAKIAAGTITADKLLANSLTAGQIQAGAISTTELAAGAVTAAKIATGTITASLLAVGFGGGAALNSDVAPSDVNAWNLTTTGSMVTLTDGKVGNSAWRSTVAVESFPYDKRLVPIDPSKTYRIRCWLRLSNTANGNFDLGIRAFTAAGTNARNYTVHVLNGVLPGAVWTEEHVLIGAGTAQPFNSADTTMSLMLDLQQSATAGYMEVQDVRLEEVLPGTLIQDGSITAAKISVGSLSAITAELGNVTITEGASAITFKSGSLQAAKFDAWSDSSTGGTAVGLSLSVGAFGELFWTASDTITAVSALDLKPSILSLSPTTTLSFWNATGTGKPTVTGSRGANAALASLLTALANYGLITNSST